VAGGTCDAPVCGHSLTRRMMMTGYRVPGAELYRRGIVEACTSRWRG
jgi:enoyl-CoA hydratase